MLLQIGAQKLIETLLMAFKAKSLPIPKNSKDLRQIYQNYLILMQPNCDWLRKDNESALRPTFLDNDNRKTILSIFGEDTTRLDDRNQNNVIQPGPTEPDKMRLMQNSLDRMRQDFPDHAWFLDMTVELLYIESSTLANGGSTSSAVGVIWANPDPAFNIDDCIELLIHELTHTLLFLDEWTYQHYNYRKIADKGTWCYSSILQAKRPIDKVVHSIFVAGELGSGLIDHIQKITVAAMQIADMKVCAHRS
jgi:hypothetical protein